MRLARRNPIKNKVYNLTRCDKGKGVVVIHGLPEEAGDIQKWLRQLNIVTSRHG